MPSNLLLFSTGADPEVGCPTSAIPDAAATNSEALPPDHEARARALDTRASFLVEAPAGSGKTGLLMQRFLKLLADPAVSQPEEVLAITFTRKATAELRERVLDQLQRASGTHQPTTAFDAASRTYASAALAHNAALDWNLLDRPQRLNIRTIDSVCADIASTLPLLSGSGAPRTPNPHPEPLYRLAAQRTLLQLGGPDTALSAAIRDILLHRDASLADCETLLARMLAAREQWGELVPLGAQLEDHALDTQVRPRLEAALQQVVCAGLTRAAKAISPDTLEALSWLAARLAHEPGHKGKPSPLLICADKSTPPETRAEHFDHWCALIGLLVTRAGDWRIGFNVDHVGLILSKQDKALLRELIDEVRHDHTLREALCAVRCLPPTRYPDAQWAVAKSLFRLLIRALAELKVLFAERQECDFPELSIAAKEALRSETGPADLATASGHTLRHLLVDEMQDTSSSQYELIQMLTQSWDGHSQTLFLVGDPKQSIYLFRQARVERFLRAMQDRRLGDIPLEVLQLSANFRSQSCLVASFNHTFSAIFPSSDSEISGQAADIPFLHAHAMRQSTPCKNLNWNIDILPYNYDSRQNDALDHRLTEARLIRRVIESWRDRRLPPGRTEPWRIAILARARPHFKHILAELNGLDPIPFRAIDIEPLSERPEVLDALALTRALLHPADRIAWLAVLHAPWCGLGLADLLTLAGDGASEAANQALPDTFTLRRQLLSPGSLSLFDRAWPVLQAALQQRGRTPISALVQRTWISLGADLVLTPTQRNNVNRYFMVLAESKDQQDDTNVGRITTAVDRLYAEPRPSDSGAFVVDLSTIHKAKGLEWDVVLVPALERKGRPNDPNLLNWLELDSPDAAAAHIILAPIYGKGSDPDPLYKWLTGVRSARDAAERKRLFYVACTRAREELHLFAAATLNKAGQPSAQPDTLLQAAWPAALARLTPASPDTADRHAEMFRSALDEDSTASLPTLALAASASEPEAAPGAGARPPVLKRIPLSLDRDARFVAANVTKLAYAPADALRQSPAFDRPEGSFAVRAFGNVVHRFLQLVSNRLEANPDCGALLAELPLWRPRLTASLRSEGLDPAALDRLAERSLRALQQALTDETGRWILSPHPAATSEQALRLGAALSMEMRVDRTFLAGPDPLSTGSSHLWIVDFKTTEQGSRTDALFAQQERAKYQSQLESYAALNRVVPPPSSSIRLGLYYPLVPRLIHWPEGT